MNVEMAMAMAMEMEMKAESVAGVRAAPVGWRIVIVSLSGRAMGTQCPHAMCVESLVSRWSLAKTLTHSVGEREREEESEEGGWVAGRMSSEREKGPLPFCLSLTPSLTRPPILLATDPSSIHSRSFLHLSLFILFLKKKKP